MKRLLVVASLLVLGSATPALADQFDPLLGTPIVVVPDLSNPPADGDSRHVCIIHDGLDFYRCVYIPMP